MSQRAQGTGTIAIGISFEGQHPQGAIPPDDREPLFEDLCVRMIVESGSHRQRGQGVFKSTGLQE